MRTLAAVVALAAFALPAAAGPIDTLQYRSTLDASTIWGFGPGPIPGQPAHVMGFSPLFGVITSGVPDWWQATPAYPSASFALVHPGALTAYIAGAPTYPAFPTFPEVSGSGRYYLNLELRDADGHVGSALLTGSFTAGWSSDRGYAYPDLGVTSAAIWLGRIRYDVQLNFGPSNGPYYMQDADGNWVPSFFAADPIPYPANGYWSDGSGAFYATVTPTAAPEPGTLALAAMGLGGLIVVRRVRRTA